MSDLAAQAGSPGLPGLGRLSSDERLARRAAEGDARAFAAIFRRYHQDLYRYCMAILGDSQDAQDALQNTMVKVMRALPDERRQIRLKPWLYRIAHNESIDLVRARRPAQPLDPELEAPGVEPAEEAEQRARLRRLLEDLEDLPERQRGALLMRELAGLSFEEIGAALAASPAVVRQTIYEARLNLTQMDAGRERSCEAVTRALSDADGRVARRRDIRAHLRQCEPCRAFCDQIGKRRADLAAIAPLPVTAAAGILHGIIGGPGPGSGSGSGIVGALGGGAGKAVGGSAALKSTAALVAVAVVGTGVADRSGLIHVGPSGGDSGAARSAPEASAGAIGNSAPGTRTPPAAGHLASSGAAAGDAGAGPGTGSLAQMPSAADKATAPTTADPAAPSHPAAAATEHHEPAGQGDAQAAPTHDHPAGPGRGGEGPGANEGEGGAPAHPTPPEHPTPESHPGAEDGPPAAAGGAPPAHPGPAPGSPAPSTPAPEHGPPAGHGPPVEPGSPAGHGPPAEPGPPSAAGLP